MKFVLKKSLLLHLNLLTSKSISMRYFEKCRTLGEHLRSNTLEKPKDANSKIYSFR